MSSIMRHYLRMVDQHGYTLRQALDLDDQQLAGLCPEQRFVSRHGTSTTESVAVD